MPAASIWGNTVGIDNYTKAKWKIRSSGTSQLIPDDQLTFSATQGDAISVKCESKIPANEQRWNAVEDCQWAPDGGIAGHLHGTVKNNAGDSHPFAVTYLSGEPNWIYVEIVPYPNPGSGITVTGGGAGGASGNDDPE